MSSSKSQLSIHSLCRACMKSSEVMRSICHDSSEESKSLSEMLKFVAGFDVHPDDNLPKEMCSECVTQVQASFAFKQLCLRSDAAFREILKSLQFQLNNVVPENPLNDLKEVKLEVLESDFKNFSELEDHKTDNSTNAKCNNENRYSCSTCLTRFSSLITLRNHIKFAHKGKECNGSDSEPKKKFPTYTCNVCDEQFKLKKTLSMHTKSCLKQNPLKKNLYNQIKEEESDMDNDVDRLSMYDSETDYFKNEEVVGEIISDIQVTDLNVSGKCSNSVETNSCSSCNLQFQTERLFKRHLRKYHKVNNTSKKKNVKKLSKSICKGKNSELVEIEINSEFGIKISDNNAVTKHCEECNLNYKTVKAYKMHLKRKHNNSSKSDENIKCEGGQENVVDKGATNFTCDKCTIAFENQYCLQQHSCIFKDLSKEVTPVLMPYACTLCERKFAKRSSLTAHIKRHEQQANEVHTCDICKREFKRLAHLNNHILTHTSDTGLKCGICPKTFARQESLNMHVANHKGLKKHQCNFCEKGFNMLSTLKDHIRTHTGEKPFLCSICGRGFSQITNLKEHMRRHQGHKPFKCESCEHSFVSKGELVAHSRKHSGAHPFVCDVCNGGFTTSSSLVKHRRIHTGERPYACDFCPMRFTALGTLKNHRRTHTGEKPYKCSYCEKAFAQKNDLVSHTRTHTGERPYACKTCGQAFRQSSALKTHLKMHVVKGGDNSKTSALQLINKKSVLDTHVTPLHGNLNPLVGIMVSGTSSISSDSAAIVVDTPNSADTFSDQ